MPKVFYGSRTRSVTPPSVYASDESGSEASTDIEVSRRRPAHRRGESVDASHPDSKRARIRTTRDAQGRRALQKACQRNDVDRVRSVLAQRVDIEDRDYAGTTALHDAALNGNADIVRLLLEHGAVVDVRSGLDELDTPLMDAVAAGSVEVTKLLVDAGADPRIANAVGKTAIDFLDEDDENASQISTLLESATRALRASGTPIIDGPSHPKASPGLFPPGFEARKRSTSTNFIDVTRRTGRGISADAVAHAAEGNLAFVGLALERGWRPTPEALVKAAKFGHQDVVGLLLAFGLDADATFEGQTALKAAVQRGHVLTAQLLLQSGSKLDRKDQRGRTYADLVADLPPADPMRVLIEGSESGASKDTTALGPSAGATGYDATRAMGSHQKSEEGSQPRGVAHGVHPGVSSHAHSDDKLKIEKRPSRSTSHSKHLEDVAHAGESTHEAKKSPAIGHRRERVSSDSTHRSTSDGDRHKSDNLESSRVSTALLSGQPGHGHLKHAGHISSGHAASSHGTLGSHRRSSGHDHDSKEATQHSSLDNKLGGPAAGDNSETHRAEPRSESRPEAFRLADLRAIKPKKRSKSVPEPESASKPKEDAPTGATSALGAADVSSSVPMPSSASVSSPPFPPNEVKPASIAGPIVASAPATTSRASPALSPRTEVLPPAERPAASAEAKPKWIERSNELAELAKRREKQRLEREARMLESLANEERRRSHEPHSPAAQSPLSEPSSEQAAEAPLPTTQDAPKTLAEPKAESVEKLLEAPVIDHSTTAIGHLPYFLRQLAYSSGAQDVAPLFVHFIGATPYYLDAQVAAIADMPRLHAQYPQWQKVLVAEAHKPVLWSFCRPWAIGRDVYGAAVASEEAAFRALTLAWVPKSAVDESLFGGNSPSNVRIRLDPPKSVSKWSMGLDGDLPLRLQFRSALLRRSPDW